MPLNVPIAALKQAVSFIDLSQDFQHVKVLVAAKHDLASYKGSAFPDLENTASLSERFFELSKIYNASQGVLIQKIYDSPLKKTEINEIMKFFAAEKLSSDETEALIKLNIAKGVWVFDHQKGGDFIKLSDRVLSYENKVRFLQQIADEIESRSGRIDLLIDHSYTKGNYREVLLRGILKKYLPRKYDVATGFIEGCKRQCDILIYDAENFSPFFREEELVVVPAKSVAAIIEVKTTLNTGELTKGLELLAEISREINLPAPVFKGIFAFKQGYDSAQGMASRLHEFYSTEGGDFGIRYLYEGINSICVLNKQCLVMDVYDYFLKDEGIRPRYYSVQSDPGSKFFSAAFFDELFAFLDVEKHAKKENVNYFKFLDYKTKYLLEADIYEPGWIPSQAFLGEHSYEAQSIWERVSDVINWKWGNYTKQELEEKYFSHYFRPEDYHVRFENNE